MNTLKIALLAGALGRLSACAAFDDGSAARKTQDEAVGIDAGYRIVRSTPLRQSIDPDTELSELFKDVFLYHWKEESQRAIIDELEWVRHGAGLTAEKRDQAVDEFIELVAAVDGILNAQAKADAAYFAAKCGRAVDET